VARAKYTWSADPLIFWVLATVITVPLLGMLFVKVRRARPATVVLIIGAILNLSVVMANDGQMPVAASVATGDTTNLGVHWQAATDPRLPWLIDRWPGGFSVGDVLVLVGGVAFPIVQAKDRKRAMLLIAFGALGLLVTLLGVNLTAAYVAGRLGSKLPDAWRLTFAGFAGFTWLFACIGVFTTYKWVRGPKVWPTWLRLQRKEAQSAMGSPST